MIESLSPIWQAVAGTMFTWGVTAAGAGVVFVSDSKNQNLLDASLGFSAGVMLAASYWSLLAPAIEMATDSKSYGEEGEFSFVPVSIGFLLGAAFVYGSDVLLKSRGITSELDAIKNSEEDSTSSQPSTNEVQDKQGTKLRKRKGSPDDTSTKASEKKSEKEKTSRWRRTLLLAIAVTVHNIPEGLAVGVGFGAVGTVKSATFARARNLAIGIGIQNFPEGLAVSMPLHRAGYSKMKAFWYGQMSGMVEPIAGLLGAMAVSFATPLLPYALSFAAGAMVYVVMDDIVPEYQESGNQTLGTWGCIVGFIVMMSLDVALG
eukprot:m.104228 g.104228  ORF g.104228 m.104228 type:complete len:318 (+) comp13838_c0_seq6:106-1059(+)